MRILHLPSNPADQAGIVVRELRKQGHDAELWHFGEPFFGFQADRVIDVSTSDPAAVWPHFLEALDRFDVFHFHFGRTFFSYGWKNFPPYWDLPVLRALGKKIVFTYVGSDCRTPPLHSVHNGFSELYFQEIEPDPDRITASIDLVSNYADKQLAMSVELMAYVPGSEYISRAFPLDEWEEQPAAQREVPVIIHVPSRRALKGTTQIVEAMETLKAEGLAFDFRMYERLSHEELVKLARDADVVIDNIVMGDHGIASVEAMASSRVAVAYLIDPVKQACPGLPVYDANPANFAERMRALIPDRDLRLQLASAGRAYVKTHWDVSDVARRHIEIYQEPVRAAPTRPFGDWMAAGGSRRVTALQSRLDERVQQLNDLARENKQLRTSTGKLERRLARAQRWSLVRLAKWMRLR